MAQAANTKLAPHCFVGEQLRQSECYAGGSKVWWHESAAFAQAIAQNQPEGRTLHVVVVAVGLDANDADTPPDFVNPNSVFCQDELPALIKYALSLSDTDLNENDREFPGDRFFRGPSTMDRFDERQWMDLLSTYQTVAGFLEERAIPKDAARFQLKFHVVADMERYNMLLDHFTKGDSSSDPPVRPGPGMFGTDMDGIDAFCMYEKCRNANLRKVCDYLL